MIRIWIACTDHFQEKEVFTRGCGLLDAVRLEKTKRCKKSQDKARSLCCGLLLQYALGSFLKQGLWQARGPSDDAPDAVPLPGPEERKLAIRYGYGAYGKPYFLDYPQFHFSLSHSGAYAALACADRELGMDLQQSRPVREGTAARVLSPPEYDRYAAQEHVRESAEWFYRCWCAKESYGKLKGTGLLCDPRRITLAADGTAVESGAERALCREYLPVKGYYMNVCVAQTEDAVAETSGKAALFPEAVIDVTEELLAVLQ